MKDRTKPMMKPQETPPVAYEDLKTAADVIVQAATGPIAVPDLCHYGVNLMEATGGVVGIRLTNDPLNKAMFATRQRFRDPDQWLCLIYRWFAMRTALEDWLPDLQGLAENEAERSRLRRSVLEAAAITPLTQRVRFQRKPILGKVAEFQKQSDGVK